MSHLTRGYAQNHSYTGMKCARCEQPDPIARFRGVHTITWSCPSVKTTPSSFRAFDKSLGDILTPLPYLLLRLKAARTSRADAVKSDCGGRSSPMGSRGCRSIDPRGRMPSPLSLLFPPLPPDSMAHLALLLLHDSLDLDFQPSNRFTGRCLQNDEYLPLHGDEK